ncbi:exodeoxyribonuclease V beta subunit [Chitinivorax tropicus]|uniref:RecBCD enzyme subunit RecB n=1 Tax=Chitinivorax tropicus TaxID=714531 RepID=A0A840MRK1_9PROT|nr:exodeoxyribonuclease V subunit beta [Chitinivorax tropicus]MBB5019412.1 exodeoxyribonuclease V beta subunit [Chitinivorax tropicus]
MPDSVLPLDVFTVPLDRVSLIEASAGTGKTWTITGLYTRLILEHGLTVDQILVVTYTKAATAELRERVRARLVAMLRAFEQGHSADGFCQTLIDQYTGEQDLAIRRLTRAISSFDDAAIHTIHGFCQRVLRDAAFESGTDFDAELLTDEHGLLIEAVADFWRREVGEATGAWAAWLADKQQTPDSWLLDIAPHIGKQDFLSLIDMEEPADNTTLQAQLHNALNAAHEGWFEEGDAAKALLLAFDEQEGFNTSHKGDKLQALINELDTWVAEPPSTVPNAALALSDSGLYQGFNKRKKKLAPPSHPVFRLFEAVREAHDAMRSSFEIRLAKLKNRLLAHCNAALVQSKQTRRQLSYHDLLNKLAEALRGDNGPHLAEHIRDTYRAALIDEFQDTDPVQYDIFRHVYVGQALPVFLVGDPKQAIYSFRGADIYTYLAARQATDAQYTLNTNQRSLPGLVRAVNALFSAKQNPLPFLDEGIGFQGVQAAEKSRAELVVPGDPATAFRFLMLPQAFSDKQAPTKWGKTDANHQAAASTASEIVRLLNLAAQGQARIAGEEQGRAVDRPLGGGDIAVLVPSHRQASLIHEALAARGVPSVRQGQDSVFATTEARQWLCVLQAILQPAREPLLRAALATELMGLDAAQIAALQDQEQLWEQWLARFAHWHRLWREHGFMHMFRDWLDQPGPDQYNVSQRVLAFFDGERRLTNLLHLAELTQVENRRRAGLDSVLAWFEQQCAQPEKSEEKLMRLESDADRVRIVTIHTSKGLEYPIVFCPFLWDGKLMHPNESAIAFHDEQGRARLNFGLGDIDQHKRMASRERLAEKLRLLYVALTRAKHRCYVVWGQIDTPSATSNDDKPSEGLHTSALAWLLHPPTDIGKAPGPVLLARIRERLAGISREQILLDVERFAARTDGATDILTADINDARYQPAPSPAIALQAATLKRALAARWRVSSFSAIASHGPVIAHEAPDHDAVSPVVEPLVRPVSDHPMADFPRGAVPGTCLHAVFEHWEFTRQDDAALAEHVSTQLTAHGIDTGWTAAVCDMVHTVLNACLPPPDSPMQGTIPQLGLMLDTPGSIRLHTITPNRRMAELEFTYHLRRFDMAGLRGVLREKSHKLPKVFIDALNRLSFQQVEGYMKGFMDLVFEQDGRYYILDWKSNWLGPRLADYTADRLLQAMAQHHYYLQYLIYTVALHRFLGQRIAGYQYETHFGGVYYLFLRGVTPDGRLGVFQDRPGEALIEALDHWMRQE